MRKLRIITETVAKLRELASDIDNFDRPPDDREIIAKKIRAIADKLDTYDARETRKDPSKRKAKKAGKTR